MITKKEFCQMQDHALLRPYAKRVDLDKLLGEALQYGFASVCINPCDVRYAKSVLGGKVGVGTVVGYPQGVNTTRTKIFEALDAIDNGADELDVVMNITRFKEGDYGFVREELAEITRTVKERDPHVLVKVIFERPYLTTDEVPVAAMIILESGADFIKEATGYSPVGKTPDEGCGPEDIRLIRQTVGDRIKIKSAGGTNSLQDCLRVIEEGAARIGHTRIPMWLQESGDRFWPES